MPNLFNFYINKSIVITGAASGIGLALAECFASKGAHLALSDVDAVGLRHITTDLKTRYPDLKIYSADFDVASISDWTSFLANASNQLGCIEVLINNAGIEGSSRPVWATDNETLKRVMDVNFYGMVHGTKAVLPYLAKREWSALINVSSIFGFIGPPNAADYAASKFAIRGYTESLHAELSQVHPHIQVHLVHPGGINTQIARLKQSQNFKSQFLTTAPAALAEAVAKGVMRNRARIVFGNKSSLVRIASRLFPLHWLSKAISHQMRRLNMTEDYQQDHPGLKIKDPHL